MPKLPGAGVQIFCCFPIIDDMDDMGRLLSFFEQRRLLNSAVTLSALGAQFVTSLLMATSSGLPQEKASWNDEETEALVSYLWEHRAECGDGGAFKDSAFNGIPGHIASLLTSGPAKTEKQCKTKYNGVSRTIF